MISAARFSVMRALQDTNSVAIADPPVMTPPLSAEIFASEQVASRSLIQARWRPFRLLEAKP